ncbi:MAG: MFS transporter [Comamonadaceae bacterium]|nr:MAG: MFS transporter [Comamonadaceae bacterium]
MHATTPQPPAPAPVPASGALIALTLLAFFMADVRDGLGPFLATYLQESRVPQHVIGYTMTAGGLAGVLMTPLAGAWVDRTPAKRALIVVPAIAIVAASAVAFSTLSGVWLLTSQIVTGVAGALLGAAMAALTLGLSRAASFKRQMGRNEASSHAGNMLSAVAAGVAAHYLGAHWILAVMVVMTVGMLLSAWAIDPQTIDHAAARGDENPLPATSGSRKPRDGRDVRDVPVADQPAVPVPPAWWRNPPLLLFGLACAFFHLGNGAMLPLLNQRLAATVPDSAPLLWTGIAIVVAQVTMIPVALWVARSKRLDIAWFVYAAILILPVRGLVAYAIVHAWGNIPVQVLDGLAAGALGVATPLLVQRYTQGSGRFNTALGLVMTMQGVGAALSPGLGNWMVGETLNFGLAFLTLAGAAVVALPVFRLAQSLTRHEPAAGAIAGRAPPTQFADASSIANNR